LPDDKDLSWPGAGNDEVHEQGKEQDSDGGFLEAREGATSTTGSPRAQHRKADSARAIQKMIPSDP